LPEKFALIFREWQKHQVAGPEEYSITNSVFGKMPSDLPTRRHDLIFLLTRLVLARGVMTKFYRGQVPAAQDCQVDQNDVPTTVGKINGCWSNGWWIGLSEGAARTQKCNYEACKTYWQATLQQLQHDCLFLFFFFVETTVKMDILGCAVPAADAAAAAAHLY
jgi:hypothetical protein